MFSPPFSSLSQKESSEADSEGQKEPSCYVCAVARKARVPEWRQRARGRGQGDSRKCTGQHIFSALCGQEGKHSKGSGWTDGTAVFMWGIAKWRARVVH